MITVFHAYIARNLLYGGLLAALAKANVRIVVLVPKQKVEHFTTLFADSHAEIVGVDIDKIAGTRREVLLVRLSHLLVNARYPRYKLREKYDERRTLWAGIEYVCSLAVLNTLGRSRLARRAFRRFAAWYSPDLYTSYIEQYKPSLVFGTNVFYMADAQFMRLAHERGIRTLGMVRSWDNCYSKGVLRFIPDTLLVNTHLIKEECVALHDVPAERIEVIGLPQFDDSFTGVRTSREQFMHSLGVNPAKKLIVFAPGGAALTDIDWQFCDILKGAMDTGAIKERVHILVRNHPIHSADLSRFEGDERFTIEYPGKGFRNNRKETELVPDEAKHLADTLASADVVLWVATTLGIDAAVFDKPEIVLNFDGYETRPYYHSVRRYHDEDHMKKMLATGGMHVASTKEELIEWINRYLDDPTLDAAGRKKVVETQIVYTDGKAGERLERTLLAYIVSL